MDIEVQLDFIEKMAEERGEENWSFRTYLKQLNIDSEELDAIVHEIIEEVTSQIDCTECANCCKQIVPLLDDDDNARLALDEKMTVSDFKEKYLVPAEEYPPKMIWMACANISTCTTEQYAAMRWLPSSGRLSLCSSIDYISQTTRVRSLM